MAELTFLGTELTSKSFEAIKKYLATENIDIGSFQLTPYAKTMAEKDTATDEERLKLISEYKNLESKYSVLNGYRADVVYLHPGLPYYRHILEKFGAIHYHFENEYWYLFGGSFTFYFLGNNGRKFALTVNAGEYLSVPEGKWQWLDGNSQQGMKAMRFFNTTGKITQPPELVLEA